MKKKRKKKPKNEYYTILYIIPKYIKNKIYNKLLGRKGGI